MLVMYPRLSLGEQVQTSFRGVGRWATSCKTLTVFTKVVLKESSVIVRTEQLFSCQLAFVFCRTACVTTTEPPWCQVRKNNFIFSHRKHCRIAKLWARIC